jgi:hypothetical protein
MEQSLSRQSDARKADFSSDEWRVSSRGRRHAKPFLIEWRHRATRQLPGSRFWIQAETEWNDWVKFKTYVTRNRRDQALAKFLREPGDGTEYRARDMVHEKRPDH